MQHEHERERVRRGRRRRRGKINSWSPRRSETIPRRGVFGFWWIFVSLICQLDVESPNASNWIIVHCCCCCLHVGHHSLFYLHILSIYHILLPQDPHASKGLYTSKQPNIYIWSWMCAVRLYCGWQAGGELVVHYFVFLFYLFIFELCQWEIRIPI